MADQAPNIFPFMRFADADAALEWLSRALWSIAMTRARSTMPRSRSARASSCSGRVTRRRWASTSRSRTRTRTTSGRRRSVPRSCERSKIRTTARVSTCPPRFVHDSYELRAITLGLGTGTALVPDAHEAEMGIRRVRVRADGTVAAANPGRADRSVGARQAPINGS